MLPHFAVVAHELGHAIQDTISLDLSAYATQEQDFFARVTTRLGNNGASFGTAEQLRCQEIADNWINEFKADAVGHTLAGPAFFFALASYLELAGSGYGIAPTHPPSDLRLKTLLGALNDGTPSFHTLCLSKLNLALDVKVVSPNLTQCPAADDLFIDLSKEFSIRDSVICVELVSYITDVAPLIFDAAHKRIEAIAPDIMYGVVDFSKDLETHLDLLVGMVPPIEYLDGAEWRAAGLASILNVGWAALLSRLDSMPEINPALPDLTLKMDRLHELLLKGVELSEARRQWQEHST